MRARDLLLRLRALARPSRAERELHDEIAFHLEMQSRKHRQAGLSDADARVRAHKDFGSSALVEDECRDARRIAWLDALGQDIRYALRGFRRAPAFTLTVVLTMGVAIGAATAVFAVGATLMVRKLPVAHPEELVAFREFVTIQQRKIDLFPTVEYEQFRDLSAFSDVVAVATMDRSNITISGPGGGLDPGQARVALVSGNYFTCFAVGAERGRTLGANDDRLPSGHPVVVVSHDYWHRKLGGADDVLSRTLSLNGTTFAIIGVIPPGFTGDWMGRPVDIWAPTMMQAEVMVDAPRYLRERGAWPSAWIRVIGRLRPGASLTRAQSDAALVHARIVNEWEGPTPEPRQAEFDASRRLLLEPEARGYSPQRESFAQSVGILAGLVTLVLAIAGTNVAGMLFARAAARERDVSLRLAIGASRMRLARQALTEGVLLAAAGGVLGLAFAAWGAGALARLATTDTVKMDWGSSGWSTFTVEVDGWVMGFALLTCVAVGAFVASAPILRMRSPESGFAFGARGASEGSTHEHVRLGRSLVVAQVALSLVLVVGAGLLVRTLENLRTQDFGFRRDHLLIAWTQAGVTGRTRDGLRDLYHQVQQRISRIPGVEAAAVANHGSLDGSIAIFNGLAGRTHLPGQPAPAGHLDGWRTFVTPGYFATMGIPILAGRDFTERDTDSSARVIIVNESFARFYFGNENPVGRQIWLGWEGDAVTTIVGLVRDHLNGNPRERERGLGFTFLPYRDRESGKRLAAMSVVVRAVGAPRGLANRVREELGAIDPSLPVLKVDTLDEQLDDVLAQDRLMAALASFFGLVALFLAALGLYGLVSYRASRRTREIGVRMALGATSRAVLAMVLREGILLVAGGLSVGVIVALGAMRLLSARLFGVGAADPATLAGAMVVMAAVGMLAGLLPAQCAAHVDPMVALRCE